MNKIILALIASASIASAEDVKPFDRLSPDNVTIKVTHVSGGGKTQNDYETTWGSYDKTRTQSHVYKVELAPKTPVVLNFFFAFRDSDGEFAVPLDPEIVEKPGVVFFEGSAESRDFNLETIGYRETSGEKLIGWFVRATRDGKVVGIDGSSHRYKELAATGK